MAQERKRRYSEAEIAAKLAEVEELAQQGKTIAECAALIGISEATLHRWRGRSSRVERAETSNEQDALIRRLQEENRLLKMLLGEATLKLEIQKGLSWPNDKPSTQ